MFSNIQTVLPIQRGTRVKRRSRITSYNVCYTKLLRLARYPRIVEGIKGLEAQGFPVLVKDASLGGQFPVMCVTLMNPRTGGVFASFGAHPSFEVALERSLIV